MSLIAARGLTHRYPGNITALDALTLDVEPGIIGLVGANGAGKSTFLKILLGLITPTSGEASVLGLDVRRNGTQIRALVGYLPEHDCLPPDVSATEFVTHMGRMSGLPASGARERAADVLRSSSPRRSSMIRSSCSSTNRPTASIPPVATRCLS